MRIIPLLILVTSVLVIAGCNVTSSEKKTERTYPEAFNFETVDVQQVLKHVQKRDSVNIESFVFDIFECPEKAMCILPDGILVSDTFPPTDTLFIGTVEPKQFKKGTQYKVSLSVYKRETKDYPDLHILGYSNIK